MDDHSVDGDQGDNYVSKDGSKQSLTDDDIDPLSLPYCAQAIKMDKYELVTWLDDYASFPAKISVRSRLTLLAKFRKLLRDQKSRKMFKHSCFGQFRKLTQHFINFNGRMIHYLLLRHVDEKKKREMWFLVNDKLVCFGQNEFALITGLDYGSYPSQSRKDKVLKKGAGFCSKVTRNKKISPRKLLSLVRASRLNKEEMLKCCLVWFLHVILLAKYITKGVEHDMIKMADDLEFFERYPWGKESFELTLKYLKHKVDIPRHQQTHADKRTASYALYGFPWEFMVWIYDVFPVLGRNAGKSNEVHLPIPRMLRWHAIKMERFTEGDPFRIATKASEAPSRSGKEPKEVFDVKDSQSEDFGDNSVPKGDGGRFGVGTSKDRAAPRGLSMQVEQEGSQQRVEKMEESLKVLVAYVEEERFRRSQKEKKKKKKKKKLETLKEKVQAPMVQPTAEVPRSIVEVKKVEVSRPATEVKEIDVPRPAADVEKVELPTLAVDVEKVEFPRPAAEVKEIDVPRPAADVEKVELPRPTADVEKVELPRPAVDVEKAAHVPVRVAQVEKATDVTVPTAEVVKEKDVPAQVNEKEASETSQTDLQFDPEKVVSGVVGQINSSLDN
ncbi:uncharacterized protein LOC132619845 [Lycium barbarum]|uniref:uncharacterized protein LOC132619845 n=1 Tax=Lycium barbarum TaxID=112863 RepID=UPI00293E3664|nr:uncharacterized protein LOC132619845 [Lycium barbarum]